MSDMVVKLLEKNNWENDYNIPDCFWRQYLEKFKDRYLLERDEIGIWQIRLKQNLGFIQPYSIVKGQLVAVLSFRSQQHKTFFRKRLVGSIGFLVKITQEGVDELCLMFDENMLKQLETLLKIRKRYRLSQRQRELRIKRLEQARKNKSLIKLEI